MPSPYPAMDLNRYEFNPVLNQIKFFIGNAQEEIVNFCRKSNRVAMRQPSLRFCNRKAVIGGGYNTFRCLL